MSERIDELARHLAEATPRRKALLGLSGLALGALGVLGLGEGAAAKNTCNKCKSKCRKKNRRKDRDKNCNNKCRNKCRNN